MRARIPTLAIAFGLGCLAPPVAAQETTAPSQPATETATEPATDAASASAAEPVAPSEDALADGALLVELNKFEDGEGGGCRAFFLFRNRTGTAMEAFEMSLAILDADGVIDRLLTIDAAPLPASRTTLKLFDIPEIACTDISEVLLHDLPACKPQNADPVDCFGFVELASRASAPLVK